MAKRNKNITTPNSKIKVLFLSAEVAPLAKVGGLGDVAGALPKALASLGVDIRICLPGYGLIDRVKYPAEKIIKELAVPAENKKEDKTEIIDVWLANLPGTKIPVYLIEHGFFSSKNIYAGDRLIIGDKYTRQADDLKRFSFFTRAALEAAKKINFKPDIVHANDWHTALAADFIKTLNRQNDFFSKTKILYTIHNLANQGITGSKNYMAEGILKADLINTVSPTYAKEILTKKYGAGLEKILKKRKADLYGILNGIDTDFFNPAADGFIKEKYSLKTLEKKSANKLGLQKRLGLKQDKNTALAGLVTRFVWQKGIELITEKFSGLNCQFVFLGSGEKRYEEYLSGLAKKYPDKFKVLIRFDEKLAHEIYAASDIFLVPSRFEPCGLTQMIAMRYGAVPLVRAIGGLADTVAPLIKGARGIKPTGFTFKKYSGAELYKTLNKALAVFYKNKARWRRLKINGLKQNFSWDEPARQYLKLYKELNKPVKKH